MAAKKILYDQEAREAVRRGVKKLAEAVKVTLGPRGRNVVIQKSFGAPTVTKDGVTVAKEIELEDAYEDMGAQMVKEVASKTSDVAGDGTTTATILAEAIFDEGLKNVAAGANPVDSSAASRPPSRPSSNRLKKLSKPVSGRKEIAQVGAIAANNDHEIGDMIAEAMESVGKDGVITVEEGKSLETTVEWVEGMQFDKGYVSPHFVTSVETMEAILEEPYILIYEKKLSAIKDLIPMLEKVAQSRQAAAHHRGGHRGRGAGDAGGQQAARHVPAARPSRRRASATAARRCCRTSRCSRAARRSSRTSASSSRACRCRTSAARRGSSSTRKTRPSSRARAPPTRSRGASPRSASRSRPPRAITTARSSRRGWRSSRAAWPR